MMRFKAVLLLILFISFGPTLGEARGLSNCGQWLKGIPSFSEIRKSSAYKSGMLFTLGLISFGGRFLSPSIPVVENVDQTSAQILWPHPILSTQNSRIDSLRFITENGGIVEIPVQEFGIPIDGSAEAPPVILFRFSYASENSTDAH